MRNLIGGIYRLMKADVNSTVNVCNPDEYTIVEFADIIKKLTKSKSEIVFKKLPVDDPRVRHPDITKAEKELGWKPKVRIKDGLIETIKWFRDN